MRLVPIKALSLLLLLLVFILISPGKALPASGNVPLDSDVYRQLDLLTAQGLLRTHLAGTRPITWAEAYRLLEEARERVKGLQDEGRDISSEATRAMEDLERSIYSRLTGAARVGSGPVYAAVHDPGIKLEYLNGEPSPIPGIKASQHALVYNNEGIDPDEGATATVYAEAEGALGPFYLQLYPRLTTGEDDREAIHRGSLKIGPLAGLTLNMARESLWWGQGVHGGLYLTNNAAPLDMLHLSTPHPTVLPWILKYLGPFRFELFLSQLEEDRAVPEPYFIGMRTNFRPVYGLEIGLTMMAMTGGEGRPGVSFGDLFDILFGENDISGDRSNNIAGIDMRFNLPGYQLYLEVGGEDEAGSLPSKDAALIGFYFPGIAGTMDLRLEYADFAFNEENANAWYHHGTYTDGYTYDGRIIGHHVGGGGRDLFAEVTFAMGEGARGSLGVDLERRGIYTQPEVEQHTQIMAGWKGELSLAGVDTEISFTLAADRINNSNYISGEKATNGYAQMKIKTEI